MPLQIKSNSLTKSKCWNLSHRFFKCIENEFNNNSKINYKVCISKYNDYVSCVNRTK